MSQSNQSPPSLEELVADFERILDDVFARLKSVNDPLLVDAISHQDFLQKLLSDVRLRKVNVDEIDSSFVLFVGSGGRYSADFYRAACMALLQAKGLWRHPMYIDSEEQLIGRLRYFREELVGLLARPVRSADDYAKEAVRAGGIARAEAFQPVKDKVVDLLDKMATENGWKSKAKAIEAIHTDLVAFVERFNTSTECKLSAESLLPLVMEWSRNDKSVGQAFARHVTRKRQMRQSSEKSSA